MNQWVHALTVAAAWASLGFSVATYISCKTYEILGEPESLAESYRKQWGDPT